ncbi:MAG: hypothetical protein LBU85_12705 [Treponema sp.]|jgi:hypothetical protein|nr:hypothetical protein [Treponema sp.]
MAKRKNVIAPNDEKSLVAMEKMSAEIEKARDLYGDGEPFEEERVLDCIVFRYKRAGREIEAMGKYCKWLKAEVGHGRFLEGLKRRDISERDAQWAMLIVETFGSNTSAVSDLGIRKARYLTAFTKEEIDVYAKGGPLGDIPHDDVAKMTTRELEAEVRRLRNKLDEKTKSLEAVIKQKTKKIGELEDEINYRDKPTKEQIAEKRLEDLHADFFGSLMSGIADIRKALSTISKAEQIESVTYPLIRAWMNRYTESVEGLTAAYEDLLDAIKQPYINNGEAENE